MPIVVEKQHVVACAPQRRADADEMPLVAAITDAADDDPVGLRTRQPPGVDRMVAARGGEGHLFIVGASLEWRHGKIVHWRVTDWTGNLVSDVVADASSCRQRSASHATQRGDGDLHATLPDTLTSKCLNHRVLSLPLGCPRRILRRPEANSSAHLYYTPRLAKAWDSASLPHALP